MSIVWFLFALCLLPQEEDLRDLSGMLEQDVASIKDNESLNPSNAQFKKLLYRTGTVDAVVLRQWSARSKDVSVDQLAADPAAFRFHPFSMDAKANSIQRFDFAPKDAKDFLSGFYFANCQTKEGVDFVLVSRSSIASWQGIQDLGQPQPIRFDGFYMGNFIVNPGQENQATAKPVFIARRFAWFPDQENKALEVDALKVALAKEDVDISLLDIVKSRKGKPIGNRESTCYWQMMAASKAVAATDPDNRIDFATMLRKPIQSVGKTAALRGRVRQCVPVTVTSPEVRELLGVDTWFQVTIFPDLDGRPIEVGTRDGDPEVYQNAFPVTVCMVNLPQGYDFESIVGNTFQCSGVFYRIWAYPSERTDKSNELRKNKKNPLSQPSPLIMGASMVKVESTSGQLQTMLGAILLAMFVMIGFVGWFVHRSKKPVSRTELPDQIEAW